MRIKTKILWTLLGMSLLVTFMPAVAVNRLRAATVSVTEEAQDVAHVVGFLLTSGSRRLSESAQQIVAKLNQTQGATLKDGKVRTFVEVSDTHPAGGKEVVVPVEGEAERPGTEAGLGVVSSRLPVVSGSV